jgi:hypothetical protein
MFCSEAQVTARFLELRAAKPLGNELAHKWHARLAADKNNLVEVFGFHFRVGERAQTVRAGAHHDLAGESLQLVARKPVVETKGIGEERQADFDLGFG